MAGLNTIKPPLQALVKAIEAGNVPAMMQATQTILGPLAAAFVTPAPTDERERQSADLGRGDALLLFERVRAKLREVTLPYGLSGVPFDVVWLDRLCQWGLAILREDRRPLAGELPAVTSPA